MKKEMITIDANEAVAELAYKASEVIAIYPDHSLVQYGRVF